MELKTEQELELELELEKEMNSNIVDFNECWKSTLGRDFVFYDIGIIHKNIKKYLHEDGERIFMLHNDLYKYNDTSYIINLDDIWRWLGFSQKAAAKRILEKNFIYSVDYDIVESKVDGSKGRGGHNKEVILLNIKTFYLLCLKSDNRISKDMHEYYYNIEKLLINSLDNEYKIFLKNKNIKYDNDDDVVEITEPFTRSLDELVTLLCANKSALSIHLKKNYKKNYHYIIDNNIKVVKHGGNNKILYKLTEYAYELLKNSYNLRNKYIVNLSNNVKCVNIGMCIENQTIGFIENVFKGVLNIKRQYQFDKYRVDLYFIDYKLVVECDENNHIDRDHVKEKIREDYIVSLGNKFIRYNPNISSFDLSNVLKEINIILFSPKS
jgi:very-short-patch-repair endonuclease